MALEPQDREPSVVNRNELPETALKRVHGEDTFVTSDKQRDGVTQLSDKSGIGQTGYQHNATRYPGNPEIMLIVGDNGSGGDTFLYDTVHDTWIDAGSNSPYEAIWDGISAIGETDNYINMGLCTMPNGYVVAAGGEISGARTDAVFAHDGTNWTQLTSTLPAAVGQFPLVVNDPTDTNSVLVFGGSTSADTPTDNAVRVDVVNDTVTTISGMPNGGAYSLADGSPVHDGYVYLNGAWGSSGSYSGPQAPFIRYDIGADTYEELSSTENAVFYNDNSNTYGFTAGSLHSWNGYIVGIDGSGFHQVNDHAYYNPETDTWASREIQSRFIDVSGSVKYAPYTGTKRTIIRDDGVIYGGGTGNSDNNTFAYIPETEPPEFQ